MNMDIWVVGTSNQLFIRVGTSYKELKTNWNKVFKKKKWLLAKTPFFAMGQFSTPHSICINIGLWQGSFVYKCCGFSTPAALLQSQRVKFLENNQNNVRL